jgi:cell division protein FtsZ
MISHPTKIKVVGVGGSGGNAISRMAKCNLKGVELIAINSDLQDLRKTRCSLMVQIGKDLTKGLGAGMDPKIGEKAALESQDEIKEALKGADIVFVTSGLGGGTGSGASPVVAQIAKDIGVLTIGVVTLPFSFEGVQRRRIARLALKKLKERADTILTISNDKLLDQVDQNTTLVSAFWMSDEILRLAVEGISNLIVVPGIINVDFSDVKTIMEEGGWAIFGIGKGRGEKRAEIAANLAIHSPFLDFPIKGAKGVLFNITGPKDLKLSEIEKAANIIEKVASPRAKIIFGAIQDPKIKTGEVKITVIATGIEKE